MDLNNLQEMGGLEPIPLNKIPTEFRGYLLKEYKEKDKNDRQCLYWVIRPETEPEESKRAITQKFTPMHVNRIADFCKENNIANTDELIGKLIIFKKFGFTDTNPNAMPRWLPIEISH